MSIDHVVFLKKNEEAYLIRYVHARVRSFTSKIQSETQTLLSFFKEKKQE